MSADEIRIHKALALLEYEEAEAGLEEARTKIMAQVKRFEQLAKCLTPSSQLRAIEIESVATLNPDQATLESARSFNAAIERLSEAQSKKKAFGFR